MTDKIQEIRKEIERQIEEGKVKCQQSKENNDHESFVAWSEHIATCGKLLVFINSLQEETKPQFPNYESVVDKVFGAGNLESWEYKEAEKLVFLAKEELLKDLEVNKGHESEDKSEKELSETYLAIFDKKYPILPTLKGKQKADFKNFLNKCQQEFGLKEFGIHPTQSKLFEKLTLLWAAWGAEHLGDLGKSNKYEFDKEPTSKDLEEEIDRCWEGWIDPNPEVKGVDRYLSKDEFSTYARHFAEWQKEKDEQEGKVLFEKSSGDCPKELIDIIDKEFGIDGRDENDNPLNGFKDWQCGMILNGPAISKLVKLGVEWQRQMYAHVPLKDIHDAWQELKKNKPDIENYPAVCFQKGADWRENHMKESLQVEYEKGRFDIREEMMKDAMEGEYWDGSIYLDNRPTKYEDGDEVKIIIVKEE